MIVANFAVHFGYTDIIKVDVIGYRLIFRIRRRWLYGHFFMPDLRDKDMLKVRIGRCHISDIAHSKLRDEPILQGIERPFYSPFTLW